MIPLSIAAHVGQHIFYDSDSAGSALATTVGDLLRGALDQRGRAALVVSGGKSPLPFLQSLGMQSLCWPQVSVTLADERWVAPDGPDSNEALVRAHLLTGQAASACWVGLKGPEPTPRAGLARARRRLQPIPRPFDAVVLGMGDDGHIASLFSGARGFAKAMNPRGTALLAAIDAPSAPHPRITMCFATLLMSRRIYVLVAGERKRSVIERAAAEADPAALPVSALLDQRRVPVDVYWSAS